MSVPLGPPPAIDGTLSPGEWEAAVEIELTQGVTARLMCADGELYLGLRGHRSAVISPCLFEEDSVRVLHVSGALGTAVYERQDETWQLTRPFAWDCSHAVLTASARACMQAYSDRERWTAANGRLGTPVEYELRIDVDGPITILLLYLAPEVGLLAWPSGLADEAGYVDLARGDLPAGVDFDPARWVALFCASVEPARVAP